MSAWRTKKPEALTLAEIADLLVGILDRCERDEAKNEKAPAARSGAAEAQSET